MNPTTILVTRHGLSEHNLTTDVFMGRAPQSRLTATGREQALRLGRRLGREAGIDLIFCSSLPRTMETAEIIAPLVGAPPIYPEDSLWELDKGTWEGTMPVPLPEAVRREIAAAPFDFRYGGGESYRDVVARVAPTFTRWVESHPGQTLLCVVHGDVIRSLLFHAIGFPPGKIGDFITDPCGLTELRSEGDRLHLVRFNDCAHLERAAP